MNNKYNFKEELKRDWYLFLLILIMVISSLVVYSRLPEQVPIHWNIEGEADSYAGRFQGAFMAPLLSLGLLFLLIFLPLIDPRKDNYPKFASSYRAIKTILIIFFTGIHYITLAAALGYQLDIGKFVTFFVAVLFIVMGNYMPKVRYNYFLGIRVPWTLASERVWKKTHRFGGKLFVIAGIIILLSVFLSALIRFWLVMICTMGTAIASTIYSYLIYRQED